MEVGSKILSSANGKFHLVLSHFQRIGGKPTWQMATQLLFQVVVNQPDL